ncbi:MAG: sugar ABC transporter permease [Roseburia sp.]|nr:sugar ABC transporter permease [Roseburia sp.]MCM1279237.1 sugar ABC transporter permease [Robinsoniella sp.]
MKAYKHISHRKRKETATAFLFLLPSLLGVSIFILVPFLDVIRRSFATAVTGDFIGMENYKRIFSNQAFLLAAKNTVSFAAVCLPLLISLSLFIAVLLSRMKQVQLLKSAYLFPMAVPAATVVLIWKMLFHKQGIINAFLEKVGGVSIDFMGSNMAFWVLVISYIWKNLGYTIILWLAGILGISEAILEAARVDGASEKICFWKIILPNLKPTLYTITVLSFLNSFKVFREAYLVAGSYPHESMYLLQHLFNNWFLNLELDKMAAAAVFLAIVLTGFILLLQFLWDER